MQRIFIILTEGVYLKRDTPARSAAPYPHFKQANISILKLLFTCLITS